MTKAKNEITKIIISFNHKQFKILFLFFLLLQLFKFRHLRYFSFKDYREINCPCTVYRISFVYRLYVPNMDKIKL